MKGTGFALLSCALLGLGFVFRKVLLDSMPPMVIAAFASLLSALILFVFMEFFHKIKDIALLRKREIIAVVLVGIISGFVADILFLIGLDHTYVSNAVLLSRTNPLFMALLSIVFFGERINFKQLVGILVMIVGLYVIATQAMTIGIAGRWGDMLIITAGFLWASGNTIMKKYLTHVPPEVIVLGRSAVGGFALLVFSLEHIGGVSLTTTAILNLIGLALLSGVGALFLWYKALELTSEANVGLTAFSIPLFTIAYAYFLLGETLAPYQIGGGFLILFGLIIIEFHLSHLKELAGHLKIRRLLHT